MDFNERAADWDNDPKKWDRSQKYATEIISFMNKTNELKAMEFGAGTGLLSFALKDDFADITLVDTSEGMINVLKEKIASAELKHFHPVMADLFEGNDLNEKYDIIYTLMSFHHVIDTEGMIKIFNKLLNIGGVLSIADLIKEDGSFHSHIGDFDGHNGFDLEILSALIENCGFEVELKKEFYTIKKLSNGIEKAYPVFVLFARKIKDLN